LETDPRSNGLDGWMDDLCHWVPQKHQEQTTQSNKNTCGEFVHWAMQKSWTKHVVFGLACVSELVLLLRRLFSEQMKQRQKQMCETAPTKTKNNQLIMTNEQLCVHCQQSTSPSSITRLALCHKTARTTRRMTDGATAKTGLHHHGDDGWNEPNLINGRFAPHITSKTAQTRTNNPCPWPSPFVCTQSHAQLQRTAHFASICRSDSSHLLLDWQRQSSQSLQKKRERNTHAALGHNCGQLPTAASWLASG